MAPPRFQLEGKDYPVYHGETSMHEDGHGRSSINHSSVPASMPTGTINGMGALTWSEEDLRRMTRLRHKYASPEEGEAYMDAYFCWASPTYAVVNRGIFLRESTRLHDYSFAVHE